VGPKVDPEFVSAQSILTLFSLTEGVDHNKQQATFASREKTAGCRMASRLLRPSEGRGKPQLARSLREATPVDKTFSERLIQ
jgi:hypothetical protein